MSGEAQKPITTRMPVSGIEQIDRLAAMSGGDRSEMIREMLGVDVGSIIAARAERLDLAEIHVRQVGRENIAESQRRIIVQWVNTGPTDAPPW